VRRHDDTVYRMASSALTARRPILDGHQA
jgi:hypothetical protein